MSITKEKALCIFFDEKHTAKNAIRCEKKLKDWDEMDICWVTHPRQPVLVLKTRISKNPLLYRRYSLYNSVSKLENRLQAKHFLNEAYWPVIPHNSSKYHHKWKSSEDIFHSVSRYTDIFLDKSIKSFASWSRAHGLYFLSAKKTKDTKRRLRELYVLDKKYHESLLYAVIEYLPKYQKALADVKEANLEIVGYAFLPPSEIENDIKVARLQRMIDGLKQRSFASKVFVSFSSEADTPLHERDIEGQGIIHGIYGVAGNTQEMLEYFRNTDRDICLAAIDFSGIVTGAERMRRLLEENHTIKKVAIDTFNTSNKEFVVDANSLMLDSELFVKFDEVSDDEMEYEEQ